MSDINALELEEVEVEPSQTVRRAAGGSAEAVVKYFLALAV